MDVENLSERELVQLYRAGDDTIAEELFRRTYQMAVRLARTLVRPGDEEGIASESFTRVLEAIKKGGGPTDSFSLYLRTTVRNQAANRWRLRWRVKTIENLERIITDQMPDPAELESDFDELIAASFKVLPERWQQVLSQRILGGLDNRASARQLGISPTAEAVLYARARRGFKRYYREQR